MDKLNIYSSCLLVLLSFGIGLIQAQNTDSCLQCHSQTNPFCVNDTSRILPTACGGLQISGVAPCYTRIVDGFTLRGCTSDLDEGVRNNCTDDLSSLCHFCWNVGNNGNCNSYNVPSHRLQCHQCTGDLNATACTQQTITNPTTCPIFNASDSCFIRRSEIAFERGCISSSNTLCADPSHCFICNGNGCNSHDSTFPQIPLAPNKGSIISLSLTLSLFMTFIFISNRFLH